MGVWLIKYVYTINEILMNKMKKIALISGITGQDGSFLAEFLIEKGYEVHGILRRSSSFNTARIEHLYLDEWVRDMKKERLVNLHYGDMTDSSSLIRIIQQVQPDEIYNLAAQSHVKVSFDVPEYTAEADAIGTLRMLEAVRILGMEKKTRIYQASTSELFGLVQEVPQKETTPFYPRSPYGVAKQYGFWITKNYRESYGMYAVNGILFNHESERRGSTSTKTSPVDTSMPFSFTPSPSQRSSIPTSLKASVVNSRTVWYSPVAITKSSGVSC